MSKLSGNRSTYGHRIAFLRPDEYRISWTFDTKVKGSRLRHPRTICRVTDENGAKRFAKKWNVAFPQKKLVIPSRISKGATA